MNLSILPILPMNIQIKMAFTNILKKSYRALYLNGVRSNERIKHIHHWIKEEFREKMGNSYNYYAYNPNDRSKKEFKINGSFYDKKEGILYAHVIICPNPLPYYLKGGEFKCKEKLNDRDFIKYIKLDKSNDIYSPDFLSINIIDLNIDDYINPNNFKNLDIKTQSTYLENLTSGLNISDNNSFGLETQKYLNNSNIELLIELLIEKM